MIPRKQMSPFAPRKYAHGGAVGSCSVGELARQSTPLSRERKATMGVGKPGGFTNRVCYPRAGGAVVLPGGFANNVTPVNGLIEHQPDAQAKESDDFRATRRCPSFARQAGVRMDRTEISSQHTPCAGMSAHGVSGLLCRW